MAVVEKVVVVGGCDAISDKIERMWVARISFVSFPCTHPAKPYPDADDAAVAVGSISDWECLGERSR